MTYKEFKDYVESKGAKDGTKLCYKDMNFGGRHSTICEQNLTFQTGIVLFDSIAWKPCY